jgi:hypothetical protein
MREQAMNRRSFIAGLGAGMAAIGLARKSEAAQPSKVVEYASNVTPTLTGRILGSLKRRKALGLTNGAICVSDEGFRQIEREHGLEDDGRDISLRGVPVFRRPEITAPNDYWVLETRRGHEWEWDY